MHNTFFTKIIAIISSIFKKVFGQFSWNTPPWINYLHHSVLAKPRKFWGLMLFLILFISASLYGWHWYRSLPQPERIIAKIAAPKLTPVDKILIPDNLVIDFGIPTDDGLANRPVAPLNLVGKEVTKGITITPKINGKWMWDSDSRLVFTPATDWPAGQTYTIQFAKDFFTPHALMASWSESFSTLPFEATIGEFKFYQDPRNPKLRQAVATINFNFPVDTTDLENKITLQWQTLKNSYYDFNSQSFHFTLTFDEPHRTAYLHSEPIPLPQTERYLELTLAKNIKPQYGPAKITKAVSAEVLVPDAASYFKISDIATSIVRNQQDRPEQILTVETTLGVTEAELTKSLHAFLLPKDYPATSTEEAKLNYHWQDPGEITENILALSKPLNLQAIPADRDFSTLHSFKYSADASTYLYIKVNKGVKGFGDFVLANNYTTVLTAPEYPQELSFLHKGALLALGTEEKLSVLVRGLEAVKFDIARVLPNDVNHLVTQTGGDFSNPYFLSYNFSRDNITEIYSEIQKFDTTDAGKEQYTALDLKKYLSMKSNSEGALGLFLLKARGWDAVKNKALNVETNRLVLITDLGIIVKDNIDFTHDVYVQSITQGTPAANVSVSIVGKNGIPILSHMTDAQGHASFPTLKDFIKEREPTVYIVQNGHDVSFMPYNRSDRQLNYSRFDIGGITSNSENQAALTAYVFSDRGIYRPGDTAHIGMIVKQPYVLPQPAGLPLEATIVDPRGTTVKDVKIMLNESGYLTLDFQTNSTSPTGQYQIYLYIVKDNHPSSLIGSSSLQVAEFLPDRMRISAQLSTAPIPGWISPSALTASINLWNLYGAPAANHRIGAKILLTPKAVTFKEFPDYTFIDPLLNPKVKPKVFTDTLTETHTDNQGHAEFDLKLDRFEKATYQLTVFAEGFEAEGGRSVTTQTTALVSPLAYLVGYKPDGDLSYIKQNTQRSVQLIAVNPQLKQQSLNNLKIQVFSLRPVSTLVKNEDGTYQYQSIIQTSQLSSNTLNITDQGTTTTLPSDQIGDFLVTIVDQNDTELSRFKFSVMGQSQLTLPKNAELNVKLNKSEFNGDEDIEMQITAPYTGAGLITIERDKVYASQWFKTDTTSSIQKIRIPHDFQGDGYVNIAFVRDLNSSEIFMSPLSYSVIPFSVTHKNHEIQIDLSTPKLSRPGDSFAITYKTDKPGKIIVYAVDEGILQVAKYQTPNPLKFFFEKHALEVNTWQIVDQILPKFISDHVSTVGGDAGEAALRSHLNPFKRKTEAPVVYWSGIIDTDTTPHQLNYQIPDYFNGTIRVMAVAVAADAVGAASQSSEVRGYFVINPNLPTFVAPGDEFEMTASIANNVEGSGANANIAIDLSATAQLEIISAAKQNLVIPEGQERSLHIKVRAKSQLGSAEIKLTATLGDKSSHLSSTLSVRPATPFITNIISGYTQDSKKILPLDRVLYPEYRNVEAMASSSPLILVTGLQQYLQNYPYGCVEQLVSKAFPWLAMANQPWFATDMVSINNKIQQTIQILSQRQISTGAFNYWPEVGSTSSNDFSSVYAMHFLTEAKAQGYHVPNEIFSAGISFLKDLATQSVTNLDDARIHAYAIYILTRNEIITTNYLTHLQLTLDQHPDFDWHNDIISAYIAATYQMLKNSADAEKIIGYYKLKTKNLSSETDFYTKNTANAQYVYLIAKHFPNRLPNSVDMNVVMSLVNALNDNTISTILSAYTSIALAAYNPHLSSSSDTVPSITATLYDNKEHELTTKDAVYKIAQLNLVAKNVIFNNPGKQTLFYQLTQAGFDKSLPSKATQQGIEVYRELRNSIDIVTNSVTLGDEIVVTIRARATDNQEHNNIALVDLLPGGFEVVRDSIQSANMDYVDVREDRVVFFGNVGLDSKQITYKIKATNVGKYIVPPIYGTAMYNPTIQSIGVMGSISVVEPH